MRLWIEPAALGEIAELPGNVRQRVRRAVRDLQAETHPSNSRGLQIPDDAQIDQIEARRLRIDNWRIIYVIDEQWDIVTVLAVRKRPPYNYDDLPELFNRL